MPCLADKSVIMDVAATLIGCHLKHVDLTLGNVCFWVEHSEHDAKEVAGSTDLGSRHHFNEKQV